MTAITANAGDFAPDIQLIDPLVEAFGRLKKTGARLLENFQTAAKPEPVIRNLSTEKTLARIYGLPHLLGNDKITAPLRDSMLTNINYAPRGNQTKTKIESAVFKMNGRYFTVSDKSVKADKNGPFTAQMAQDSIALFATNPKAHTKGLIIRGTNQEKKALTLLAAREQGLKVLNEAALSKEISPAIMARAQSQWMVHTKPHGYAALKENTRKVWDSVSKIIPERPRFTVKRPTFDFNTRATLQKGLDIGHAQIKKLTAPVSSFSNRLRHQLQNIDFGSFSKKPRIALSALLLSTAVGMAIFSNTSPVNAKMEPVHTAKQTVSQPLDIPLPNKTASAVPVIETFTAPKPTAKPAPAYKVQTVTMVKPATKPERHTTKVEPAQVQVSYAAPKPVTQPQKLYPPLTNIEKYRISSGFTSRRLHPIYKKWKRHDGTDYAAPAGTPVKAACDGVVTRKSAMGGYGRTVIISCDQDFVKAALGHNGRTETLYAHLSRYGNIQPGQTVKAGDIIGKVGSSGDASGPHLHFEVRKNGQAINAASLIRKEEPTRVAYNPSIPYS
ncbi:MAG: peptidoglycan DD-metalloendopeptidase family protein [Rhodospirillales bacterium]|nr:peptidoglycan DD-metalloendopeptidase family protein [Rhodospirillales bacterium]